MWSSPRGDSRRIEKPLHVSPFMGMDQGYDWWITSPGDGSHRIASSRRESGSLMPRSHCKDANSAGADDAGAAHILLRCPSQPWPDLPQGAPAKGPGRPVIRPPRNDVTSRPPARRFTLRWSGSRPAGSTCRRRGAPRAWLWSRGGRAAGGGLVHDPAFYGRSPGKGASGWALLRRRPVGHGRPHGTAADRGPRDRAPRPPRRFVRRLGRR